jgi:hypothetical protein
MIPYVTSCITSNNTICSAFRYDCQAPINAARIIIQPINIDGFLMAYFVPGTDLPIYSTDLKTLIRSHLWHMVKSAEL